MVRIPPRATKKKEAELHGWREIREYMCLCGFPGGVVGMCRTSVARIPPGHVHVVPGGVVVSTVWRKVGVCMVGKR